MIISFCQRQKLSIKSNYSTLLDDLQQWRTSRNYSAICLESYGSLPEADDMQLRICIIGYTCPSIHRGFHSTFGWLENAFCGQRWPWTFGSLWKPAYRAFQQLQKQSTAYVWIRRSWYTAKNSPPVWIFGDWTQLYNEQLFVNVERWPFRLQIVLHNWR